MKLIKILFVAFFLITMPVVATFAADPAQIADQCKQDAMDEEIAPEETAEYVQTCIQDSSDTMEEGAEEETAMDHSDH